MSTPGAGAAGSRPEASVVVPTHDRARRLAVTVGSALAQDDVALEVIVVDDGSTDSTAEWLAGRSDPRLKVVRHDTPRGVARARNSGIDAARGEWLAFLDDDDLWSPAKLRTQIDRARGENAGWVYSGVVIIDEQARPREVMPLPDPAEVAERLRVTQVIPAGSSNVVARSDLVRRLGGFDDTFAHLADWDLWIRLATAEPAAACPEVLVGYVEHASNMHTGDLDRVGDELAALAAKHGAEGLDMASFRRWVAWGHRRAGRRWRAATVHLGTAMRHRRAADLMAAGRSLLGHRPLRRRPPVAAPDWLLRYR